MQRFASASAEKVPANDAGPDSSDAILGTLHRTTEGWQLEDPWGHATTLEPTENLLDPYDGDFVSLSGRWPDARKPDSKFAPISVQLLSKDPVTYANHVRQEMSDPAKPPATPPTVRPLRAVTAGNAAQTGRWSPVQDIGVYALHAALRPDGKVLFWHQTLVTNPANPQFNTLLWDPLTREVQGISNRTMDGGQGWCSAHSLLSNGSMLAATGLVMLEDPATYLFDNNANTWTRLPRLKFGRYYPSTTTLADGRVLVAGGDHVTPGTTTTPNPFPELYEQGAWRTFAQPLVTEPTPTEGQFFYGSFFPWIQQAPGGALFYAGPQNMLRNLYPNSGLVTAVGQRGDGQSRDYGSYATYDIGKVLVVGGGNSLKTAYTIDYNGTVPVSRPTGTMSFGRRHLHATILADGKVLASGGHSEGGQVQASPTAAVFPTEIWDPATGQWSVSASLARRREYHTSALLLPDARVVHAGGDCEKCSKEANLEVFSPPYLFNPDGTPARRPEISQAPTNIGYGRSFTVEFANAGAIRKIHLLKLGQSTHSTNFDQRLVPLSFTTVNKTLTVTAPANQNIAPPGYYMLFILNARGVPSVAPIIKLGAIPGQITETVATTGRYTITNKANGLCMTAKGTDSRSAIVQATCNNSDDQKFRFEATTPGYYRIISVASGRVLDIDGADVNKDDGARIQINDSVATEKDQQWHVLRASPGFVRLLNRNSARNIDVPGNNDNTASGVPLSLYFSQAEATDQQWSLNAVAD